MMQRANQHSGLLTGTSAASRPLNIEVHTHWLKRLAIMIVVSALTMACHAATSLLSPEARRDYQLQPGVVFIEVEYSFALDGHSYDVPVSGTGFLYRPDGYIVTNGHVVEFANIKDLQARKALFSDLIQRAKMVINSEIEKDSRLDDSQKKDVSDKLMQLIDNNPDEIIQSFEPPKITVYLNNGKQFNGEIKAYSDPISEGGKDVAIIKIDGKNLPTVQIGDSDNIRVGDPIVVIGYPGAARMVSSDESALVPTVTNGKVSAVNKTDTQGTPVIQSEASINPGNSGGPAFDEKGQVIGIATYKAAESEQINFFVPSNTAMEFIRQAGAEPESGSFDTLWKEALDAYEKQYWSRAHTLMGDVLEMMPGEADAVTLQREASENLEGESEYDRVRESVETAETPTLIGGGLILTALIIGGLVIVISKPKPQATVHPSRPSASHSAPTVVQRSEELGSLEIINGPSKGRKYSIPKTGLRIGRDPEACTIVLPIENVGREHAWVMPMEDGGVAVIDRGSVNGTYVNSFDGGRVKKARLRNGDRIFICRENSTEIVYHSS